ncbi:MAG: glycosyltransferase family 39 protein [Anaerolineae bacterium]|nr:glycosyltransferase family 39 protein [Anaerolineae bacterium]
MNRTTALLIRLRNPVVLLALALALLAVIARLLPGARTIDDAFITFRYSRNLVEGLGFVYNANLATLGTTTPLFTLLMAAISLLTGVQDFPQYAIVVSALADACTTILLYLIARRATQHDLYSALPALLWALSPRSVTFAVGGMETSVNILWMAAAVWFYVSAAPDALRPRILIGVCVALGFLTRIDSLLWSGPLLLAQVIDTWRARMNHPPLRRLPWATWLSAGLLLAPWLLFAWGYFGSPVPNSVNAKTLAYQMPAGSALITLIQAYATPFFEYDTFGTLVIGIGALAYLLLGLLAIAYVARHLPRLLPFLIYPWLYLIVFAVANPLIFRWYLAPPLPALMLAIFLGVWSLLSRRDAPPRRVAPAVIGLLALLWVFTSLNAWTLHPDHGPDRPAPKMAWHQIELYYQDIATQLVNEYGVTPQTRVASGDIGAVGYFSRATIIDTVGLVTPAMRAYYPISSDLIPSGQNYAIPPQLVLDTQPDYLVTMEAFVRLGLEQTPAFQSAYTLVREIPTDFYGTGMRLYQRR